MKLGATDISNVMLGTTEINKVMLGTQEVWSRDTPPTAQYLTWYDEGGGTTVLDGTATIEDTSSSTNTTSTLQFRLTNVGENDHLQRCEPSADNFIGKRGKYYIRYNLTTLLSEGGVYGGTATDSYVGFNECFGSPASEITIHEFTIKVNGSTVPDGYLLPNKGQCFNTLFEITIDFEPTAAYDFSGECYFLGGHIEFQSGNGITMVQLTNKYENVYATWEEVV